MAADRAAPGSREHHLLAEEFPLGDVPAAQALLHAPSPLHPWQLGLLQERRVHGPDRQHRATSDGQHSVGLARFYGVHGKTAGASYPGAPIWGMLVQTQSRKQQIQPSRRDL